MHERSAITEAGLRDRILNVVKRTWGYDSLLPLQEEAIRAGLDGRDSLVVLPTGGGKSLCYQVPPLLAGELDVVVSPLISLMKDQVDGLLASGFPAAALHSNQSAAERDRAIQGIREHRHRLLYVSPERLAMPSFLEILTNAGVRSFAIDEAHCISHWGHDFRPEYRQLKALKERFPETGIHAFTATATERVQRDIADQLALDDPAVLVGRSDRPNLVYRVVPRVNVEDQVVAALRRHEREAAIVYCLSRKDTEALASVLRGRGFRAAPYHAGMSREERTTCQDDFAAERIDVVVATVAFGMGIDRSNVRCVIHAAVPKSVEHYQQETGRAGRDGLEAECLLLYSAADAIRWERLIEIRSGEAGTEHGTPALEPSLALLRQMRGYCTSAECRHRALSRYFGQDYDAESCGACDVCLGEVEPMAESTVVAQKILSCVARLEQRFGIGHVVKVLRGSDTDLIRARGHDTLSTFGLLADLPEKGLMNLVYQLVDQGLLTRTPGDRPILQLNPASLSVLRGEREVRLRAPAKKVRRTKRDKSDWEDVDRGLFEHLRELRTELALERQVPAYVVFGDATLRGLARARPLTPERMRDVKGVGEKKLADPGPLFLDAIREYCETHGLEANRSV